jgi:cytochrome c biogenesis protein CcdA
MRGGGGRSTFITGASIAAVELLTAAPYFAVIAGITASKTSISQQIALLALYNVCFVLPLPAIVAALLFVGDLSGIGLVND